MSTLSTILTSTYDFHISIKIALAFLGGFLPVFIWLWFWEHEDKHPEPKWYVFFVFVGGMASVFAAIFLEQLAGQIIAPGQSLNQILQSEKIGLLIFVWAAIEEIVKFAAAYFIVLRRTVNDEPVDSMMYLIIAALGFAAVENAFFLFNPLSNASPLFLAVTTGQMRFIGATLLHTICSGTIGLTLALTFYRSKKARLLYVTIGVITAVFLHTFFNLSIIMGDGSRPIVPFYAVWIAIVLILLAFEKVKSLKKPS
jgi:RsiW-degrading membrane proteinase PrsW (M82 family)